MAARAGLGPQPRNMERPFARGLSQFPRPAFASDKSARRACPMWATASFRAARRFPELAGGRRLQWHDLGSAAGAKARFFGCDGVFLPGKTRVSPLTLGATMAIPPRFFKRANGPPAGENGRSVSPGKRGRFLGQIDAFSGQKSRSSDLPLWRYHAGFRSP